MGKELTYESKCRRCLNINEWYFSTLDVFTWQEFHIAMEDHVKHPRQFHCRNCKKQTVQDIVSYTPIN